MEGGHAAADVLMGRVNPSGKMADTIALSVEDYPSSSNPAPLPAQDILFSQKQPERATVFQEAPAAH